MAVVIAIAVVGLLTVGALRRIGAAVEAVARAQRRGQQAAVRNLARLTHQIELIQSNLAMLRAVVAARDAPPDPAAVSDPPPKPDWDVENEARQAIRRVAEDLDLSTFARFVAQRYRTAEDDPWVTSVVKARRAIGLDAAVTLLRERDQARLSHS